MEPTVEKMNLAKWFVRGFILTERPFMFFVERKNYKVFCQVIRNGNQITTRANRVKIH
jgi:hypothetical protein